MTKATETFGLVTFQPLKRLAPSRFEAFRECPLREAFRAADAPRLLAAAGAAHLGSVIHRLMETASSEPLLNEPAASALFDRLITDEESQMAAAPQSRGAVPLSRSVADYEVRRLRAIRAACAKTGRRSGHAQSATNGPPLGSEAWVASADGEVGGFIDEVISRGGGIIIRDFKSGMAAHRGSPQYIRALVQLQLYAALYAEAWSVWPAEIEIVSVGGIAYAEPVDAAVCTALLQSAKELLRACNETIMSTTPPDAMHRLGRPAPDACRYCEYRPLCAPYMEAERNDGDWPRDAVGTVVRRDTLRNATLLFGLSDGATTTHIRGVSNDPLRHPALHLAVIGTRAGFFNLSGSREHRSYIESQNTTIVASANG